MSLELHCDGCGAHAPATARRDELVGRAVQFHRATLVVQHPGKPGHPPRRVERAADLCGNCVDELGRAYFGGASSARERGAGAAPPPLAIASRRARD